VLHRVSTVRLADSPSTGWWAAAGSTSDDD
jgi:hypothetical protein